MAMYVHLLSMHMFYANFKQNKRELENCFAFCNFAYTWGLMLACFTFTAMFKTNVFSKAEEEEKYIEIEVLLLYCIHWIKLSFK